MRVFIAFCLVLISCSDGGEKSDAYGNFESIETVVSSEASGRLLTFEVLEGDSLHSKQRVGLVDTIQLAIQRKQLEASIGAILRRAENVEPQLAVVEEQIRVAEREKKRIEGLIQADAATTKQLDDISGQIDILSRQMASIQAQKDAILTEAEPLRRQIDQVNEQIRRCYLSNPVNGIVLTKYAETGEVVSFGRPLYKIADIHTMFLRVYISGAQLPNVKLGQSVRVIIDGLEPGGPGLSGKVDWIASKAEFTPKIIQTKEERVNLVYAVKIRVENPDGRLKIGMPGEAVFAR